MRQRKPANITADLQRYSAAILADPYVCKGQWAHTLMPAARELRVDLGCGKGAWLAQAASAHPDMLFIGLDNNEVCVARAAEKLLDAEVPNARVALVDADNLPQMFAPGEIDRLYLNFSSPFPQKKYAGKRLTHLDRLWSYRPLLSQAGLLEIHTDHDPFWQFTLTQLDLAGYCIVSSTDDITTVPGPHSANQLADLAKFDLFESEYHQMTVARGAIVHALQAAVAPAPAKKPAQTAPLGLVSYLPADLSTLERIPYGMEDTVTNLRNRAANGH